MTSNNKENKPYINRNIRPGDFIVATKWIGIEGALEIINHKRDELIKRFSPSFMEYFKDYEASLSIDKESGAGDSFMIKETIIVSEGGIFKALGELAKIAGRGLEVDIKKIPVRQEVIEICNFFDISPYEMKSKGMALLVLKEPEALVEYFKSEEIPAAVIGKIRDDNDKLILNGEAVRYLDKIKQDSIGKIL
ncbi:MAG: hypothetical protein J6P37_01005 [Lachnospiraceae bacterium]|nr:hypothetical protein [Lachnospiraceae bacterium]